MCSWKRAKRLCSWKRAKSRTSGGLGREVLIVDWRNTLKKKDFLLDYNREALGKAMRAADIHVIRQMGSMLPQHRALLSYSATRYKTGRGGKVFLGKKRMADSIFDDQPAILERLWKEAWRFGPSSVPRITHGWRSWAWATRCFALLLRQYMPGSITGALTPEPLEKGQASASLWKKACLWKKAPCPASPMPLEKGCSCSR